MTASSRRRAFKLTEALVVFAVFVMIAALLYPIAMQRRRLALRHSCQQNLKQIMLGTLSYVRDYDERYPLVTGNNLKTDGNYGWGGALWPYTKRPPIFQCPLEGTPPDAQPNMPGYTDYWFNPRLQSVNESKITQIAHTLSFGEGNHGSGTYTYAATTTPANNLPAGTRHLAGANYAFADGHVKWLLPAQVGNAPPSKNVYTFRWK